MNTKFWIIFLLFGLMNGYTQLAQALNCGDVITRNTTLTADLHCTTGFYALEIGRDHVTLDLNGHTLSGSDEVTGIAMHGRNNVRVIGHGGALKGLRIGISVVQSDSVLVSDMLFYDLGTGIFISSSNDSVVENNNFIYMQYRGVFIGNYLKGLQANNNTVINNNFYKNYDGIDLCGDHSDKNTIKNNLIWKSERFGIHLVHSDQNIIEHNEILQTNEDAIQLDFSSYNQILGNALKSGRNGLEINAYSWGGCLPSTENRSYKNVFNGNHTFEFEAGVVLGNGHSSSDRIIKNYLNNNKLYHNSTGIILHSEAHHNDASGNAYEGTLTPVLDTGTGNSH